MEKERIREMIKIITDSTCDLTDELLERYDISVVPLYIQLGEESFRDKYEITPEEIYKWSDENNKTPKTSAPSIADVMDVFEKYDNEGTDIIYMGISSELSTTINVMRLAADEMEYANVYIIDSKSLSTGIGVQLLKAAKLREEGLSAKEIVEKIEAGVDKVVAGFVVDTLTYLHRGGRCGAVTAVFASALQIKPQIAVIDGKLDMVKKFRGNIKSVINKYVEGIEDEIKSADPDYIFITHSGGVEDIAEELKAKLESMNYFKEVHITRAGSVITSHCGPKTLGVLFYGK